MRAVAPSGVRPFAAPRSQQQRGAPAPPTARLGGGGGYGGNYGGTGGDPRQQGLILPGQNSGAQRGGQRLVVPGQGGGTAPKNAGGLAGAGMPSQQRDFRPPPGFMNRDDAAAVDPSVAGLSVDEMLNRLRSLSGQWHQLAKVLPALQAAGFDGVAVEEETGLERKTQNVWNTAVQVGGWAKPRGVGARQLGRRHARRRYQIRVPLPPACACPLACCCHHASARALPAYLIRRQSRDVKCSPPPAPPQVYESIKAPGLLPPGALEHFDTEGGWGCWGWSPS